MIIDRASKYILSSNGIFTFLKSMFIFMLVFGFSMLQTSLTYAKANNKYASIVMDADTGQIIHQRHANKSLHPASLTKVMTLLLTFEALESGKINLKDRVRISRHAASMVPSKLGLPAGSSIRVKDAIYSLVTKSANDVAVALAEHLAGSERNFATRMTNKARDIGMRRTSFKNASGLHDVKQVSTARDMAKMARYVINVYPEYYRYFSRKTFNYNGKTYRSHNRLMDSYDGMDGMKTGYIGASGFNLIASAVRSDKRIIGVVFGGRSSKSRNTHMAELLDMGFRKVKTLRIVKAPVPLPKRKPAIAHAIAALNNTPTGTLTNSDRMAGVNPLLQNGFEKLIGEGDFDPNISKRIETGLLAIAAHKGGTQTPSLTAGPATGSAQKARMIPAKYAPVSVNNNKPWSVQIGAFTSRVATDKAIHKALKSLPGTYSSAQPIIAPLKTADGWLFRARLTGFTKDDALSACNYIRDCLPVAPQN